MRDYINSKIRDIKREKKKIGEDTGLKKLLSGGSGLYFAITGGLAFLSSPIIGIGKAAIAFAESFRCGSYYDKEKSKLNALNAEEEHLNFVLSRGGVDTSPEANKSRSNKVAELKKDLADANSDLEKTDKLNGKVNISFILSSLAFLLFPGNLLLGLTGGLALSKVLLDNQSVKQKKVVENLNKEINIINDDIEIANKITAANGKDKTEDDKQKVKVEEKENVKEKNKEGKDGTKKGQPIPVDIGDEKQLDEEQLNEEQIKQLREQFQKQVEEQRKGQKMPVQGQEGGQDYSQQEIEELIRSLQQQEAGQNQQEQQMPFNQMGNAHQPTRGQGQQQIPFAAMGNAHQPARGRGQQQMPFAAMGNVEQSVHNQGRGANNQAFVNDYINRLDGASEFDLVRYEYMIRLRELQTSADQALTELFYTYKQNQGRVTVQMYYKAVKEIYEQYDRIYNHIVMDYEQKVLQIARKDTVQYRMQFAA